MLTRLSIAASVAVAKMVFDFLEKFLRQCAIATGNDVTSFCQSAANRVKVSILGSVYDISASTSTTVEPVLKMFSHSPSPLPTNRWAFEVITATAVMVELEKILIKEC